MVSMTTHPIRVGLNPPAKPPMSDLRLLVRASRLIGMDTMMIWDHFQDFVPQVLWTEENTWLAKDQKYPHEHFDYQVLLGYLAAYAGNMRLGVGVTEPIRRHPVLLAQAMMTLSYMTKRPPILGIGAGERENTEPYGLSMHRAVSRLEEALQIIRLCFTSRGAFDFDGEFFQLDGAVMDLIPDDGKTPPIWMAAHGPRMLRLTGQYADGWYPTIPFTRDDYGDRMSTIRRHAQEAGRDPAGIVGSLSVPVFIAGSDSEAREILNLRASRILGLTFPAELFHQQGLSHPLGDSFKGFADFVPESYSEDELNDALDQITPEFLAQTAIWGSPDTLADYFRQLGEGGLQHVILTPVSALASKKVMNSLPMTLRRLRRKLQ
jgi:phthiodiolone/phenolphthiodiolone dimycocerosates ketoreductase